MQLKRQTWFKAEKYFQKNDLALIPVGSTEQHGTHGPLGTDHLISGHIARKSAEAQEVLCLPVIPIGVSGHHRDFPGTLWFRPATFRAILRDLLDSLKFHGCSRVILVNGHGGNTNSLDEVALTYNQEEDMKILPWTWAKAISSKVEEVFDGEGVEHADAPETSAMLYLFEEWVDRDQVEKAEQGAPQHWGQFINSTMLPTATKAFSETGATGQPTEATKEKGQKIVEAAISNLNSTIKALLES
ncbi:MAG: creatininase family protein [Candidatus Bipolaricaulota bacterium]